jgi:predicted SnoaL-like aldol condensation-catalyzing enzyme
MGIEENKVIVRRFIDEVFGKGDLGAVDALVDQDFVPHTWPSTGDGRGDLKRAIERVSKGLADAAFTIDDMFRVRDGLIVEHWHQFDQLGMMRQLGAKPGPP